jgi:hypothetical protein
MNRYKSPELPPVESLAKVTADYKRTNDAREKKLAAGARIVLRTNAGLDELSESARCEILALVAHGKKAEDDASWTAEMRLEFYRGLAEAAGEFCTAIGARTDARKGSHLDAMHEAIASLDRYRGAGR